MGAGASQQFAAPYGADPYFGDASDPWRRRQAYSPPASYPGAHPALQLHGGTAAPPMHPAVQWGFAEAGKAHRIPQIVPAQAYAATPAYHLARQPHHGYAPAPYAQPYPPPPQQHAPYQQHAQPRVEPHAAARLPSARSTAEVLHAAQMLELALRQLTAPQAPHTLAAAPLPAALVSGGASLDAASQLEYLRKLEGRVKELEARLAKAPAAPPAAPSQYSAAPQRGIERKPQTAARLHSRPKPPAPAAALVEESYAGADPSKWSFPEVRYGGAYSFTSMGRKEQVTGEIAKGIEKLKAAPHLYTAMWYQADMVEWPTDQQTYTLHRKG